MPKKPVYAVKINCNNDIELVTSLLRLYASSVNLRHGGAKLRPKTAQLLAFYVMYGYSKETKQKAALALDTTILNVNVMNSELTKEGFLETSKLNHHQKNLNNELKALTSYIKGNMETDKLFVFQVTKS